MYNDTITLFTRYHSKIGDIWFPHIIRNVNLLVDKASMIAKYGAECKDVARLNIRYTIENNQRFIDGIPYLEPKKWYGLLNDELADTITFNEDANYFDFLIVGEYETTEPIDDDSYRNGFYNEMEKDYECYAISSVATYKAIPHFEIMCR